MPYGYIYVPRSDSQLAHLEVEPVQAAVVREMFQWFVEEQLSCRAVAARLKEMGIPSPQGKPFWNPSVVNYMIKQEVYCGTAYFGRREPAEPEYRRMAKKAGGNKKSSRKTKDRQEWIAIPTPAIIDRETWEGAQRQLQLNSKFSGRNNGKNQYLLQKLLVCGQCGKGYSGDTTHGKYKSYRYYACITKDPLTAPGSQKCPGPRVSAELIEQVVWDTVTEIFNNPQAIYEEFQRRISQGKKPDGRESRRKELRAEKAQLAKKVDNFLDLYGNERFDVGNLNRKVDEAQKGLMAVEKELQGLNRIEFEEQRTLEAMENLEAFICNIRAGLDQLTFEERRQILRLIINCATIKDKKHIRIEFAIPTGPDDQISQLRPKHPPPSPPETRSIIVRASA